MNHKKDREQTESNLKRLYWKIYYVMSKYKTYREIKNRNKLVIKIWKTINPNISCESISRTARQILVDYPELDTLNNMDIRSNREVSYRKVFKK